MYGSSDRFHGKDTQQIWYHSHFNKAQTCAYLTIIITKFHQSATMNHLYSTAKRNDNRQMFRSQQVYRIKYSVIVIISVYEVQQITAGSIF